MIGLHQVKFNTIFNVEANEIPFNRTTIEKSKHLDWLRSKRNIAQIYQFRHCSQLVGTWETVLSIADCDITLVQLSIPLCFLSRIG